ncbi:hypothetical protein BHE74_00056083 [Ensete ventricosum]|nr:hypothetical protein BHE74_00056083 [Ensete ventricosum]RZS26407.1 hypothetical protein BHM03_00059743 [Ensete ventricosum]
MISITPGVPSHHPIAKIHSKRGSRLSRLQALFPRFPFLVDREGHRSLSSISSLLVPNAAQWTSPPMPPKGQPSKGDLAKKQKIVEDKTFGLKNKNKSKNVQKYVQSLQQSVQPKPDSSKIAAKRKGEKIDLYSDQRDHDQGTMEDWDQEMLEKVVETKNKEYNQNKPTDIIGSPRPCLGCLMHQTVP